MPLKLSVIICTHNPRPDYLGRVLDALRKQTLPMSEWELVLIDNASANPVATRFDLSWHPLARHVHEEKLGLTQARLRGFRETQADLLVFFDDDNVPEPDYLAQVLAISEKWPCLGIWGGRVIGEFEIPPPDWALQFIYFLALNEVDRDVWSNVKFQPFTIPCGAGMCVRRPVTEAYGKLITQDHRRMALGRTGSKLVSHEDVDLAYTAIDVGLGTGKFVALKLLHLIPQGRLDKNYYLRLNEGCAYSGVWVDYFHGKMPGPQGSTLRRWARMLSMDRWTRQMFSATQRGIRAAIRDIEAQQRQSL